MNILDTQLWPWKKTRFRFKHCVIASTILLDEIMKSSYYMKSVKIGTAPQFLVNQGLLIRGCYDFGFEFENFDS